MVSSMNRTQSLVSKELKTESSFALNLIPLPATPLFGTDGIRGKVGEILSAPLALQIGFWAGTVLRDHSVDDGPIILGQDSRNSSDMLAMALSAGLTAAGLEVWYLGLCPTPCVAYLTNTTSAIGGVMISASHNPPEDNGIKIFGPDGTKLPRELQVAIELGLGGKTTLSSSAKQWGKHYLRADLIGNYGKALQHPLQNQVNLSGMKIVLDVAWGAAVGIA
ncbi:phosphoglucosamine mutase, partial [Cylindrospermopsis raciborskii CS-506_C]|nr:phosphoglucosamine mutase [Cylindrospermopsis raciborskii CS-506_C]